MPKTTYFANKILDHVRGNTAYTPPATLYYGLFTAVPTVAGGGTEVTGGSYARVGLTNNTTNFPNAASGAKSSGAVASFAAASALWGTIVAVGEFDALSGGNLLNWDPIDPITINTGNQYSFAIGQLQWTES